LSDGQPEQATIFHDEAVPVILSSTGVSLFTFDGTKTRPGAKENRGQQKVPLEKTPKS